MVIVLTGTAACGGSSSSDSSSPIGKSTGSGAGTTTGTSTGKQPTGSKPSTAGGPRTSLSGTDFCKSLKDESLTAIQVQPSDGHPHQRTGGSGDGGCEWESGETTVEIALITHWSIDGTDADRTITVSGFSSKEADALGNSCQESVQVNDDELELNVENDDGSNQTLRDKSCKVARDFVQQVVAGIAKKS